MAGGETNRAASVAAWWKNFSDPELDSLISNAPLQSNLDLRIAQARVREARAQYGIAVGNLLPDGGRFRLLRAPAGKQDTNRWLVPATDLPPGMPFENNFYQSGFDASWEIDVFGGKRRAVESAKAQVAAAEFGERDVAGHAARRGRAQLRRSARLSAAIGDCPRKYPRAGTIAGD